jgi:hypothetical protein
MAPERSKKIAAENDRNREGKFMNENQPYRQDDEWSDLPLPGQDESWEKMEALLDKEEKRRVIPPFFLNCAGIALVSAIIIAAAWLAFRPGGWLSENSVATTEMKDQQVQTNQHTPSINDPAFVPEKKNNENTAGSLLKNSSDGSASITTEKQDNRQTGQTTYTQLNPARTASTAKAKSPPVGLSAKTNAAKSFRKSEGPDLAKVKIDNKKTDDAFPGVRITDPGVSNPGTGQKDSTTKTATSETPADDSKNSQTGLISEVKKADTIQSAASGEDPQQIKNKKPSRYSFSAGLGVQQQLRSGTQLAYSSDYYGGNGVFSEHIPSVYFRVHHRENWFAQAEFRFGAPQFVKDYSYARRIRYDTSSNNLVVSSMRLRKLYYHQLPFSFNYNVLPRLSVGAGGVYSIFYRAVTEQETKASNVTTGTESFSKSTQRIPGFRDSFFFKSQVQFILNTDYRWKNFSIGLRYKKDLQPYIKYTKPDGVVEEDMNDAIEVILRYRLWKSRK